MEGELGFVSRCLFQHRAVAGNDARDSGRGTLGFNRVVDVRDECRGQSPRRAVATN